MDIKNITIVGGGSAGWMTAATLIKCFPNKNITLIESPTISSVSVGESTLAHIRGWITLLGIKDEDFVPYTDASYKLSIKFTDFYKKGESFHYPFGQPDTVGNIKGVTDWWFKKFTKPSTPYSDYVNSLFPQMALVNKNKLFFNEENVLPFRFKQHTAFHFDASKFGLWLRDYYCIPRGVKHIKEDIKSIEQDDEGIKTLNHQHTADLFIDCTGFRSLLLGGALKEPFESDEDVLPNNMAWATHLPYKNKRKQLVPYTNCTAYKNGWIWNIPLWSRIGTGYVYSNKFISDQDALKEFKTYLGKENLKFKNIKMRVGIHKRLWVKNVCAIGLSAGFIEPLESNGLFSVHEFLHRLVRNLERGPVSQWDKDSFTAVCRTIYNTFKEFVILHYSLSHRQDTPYWKANFNKEWISNLIASEYKFPSSSQLNNAIYTREVDQQFIGVGGFHCIAAGMHWSPTDIPSLIKSHHTNDMKIWKERWDKCAISLDAKRPKWENSIKNAPSLYDFLKKNFYSPKT